MAAAVIAAAVTYAILAIHPWPASPLSQFLAAFGRASAAVWPMQLVWYLAAAAIVALALWPGRRSPQLACALAAAYFAWIGIAYFAWQMPGMHYSWLWATAFTLQAVLLVVAGVARSDLVIRPRWDLASGLGAVFIAYALIGYPLVGVLGGHALRAVPVFGVSPCASVIFFFGLLLWAVPPAPKYVLLVPLAWLLLALMIAWSGHEDVLAGLAVALAAVTLVQAIKGHHQPPPAGPVPSGRAAKLKVS